MKKSLQSAAALAALAVVVSTVGASAEPFAEKHPRRAQVLNRTGNLNRRANLNKGDLHGHYGQIKSEDRHIAHQEQRDAHMNGGHITTGEQAQLNREENHVSHQIVRDQK